MSAKENLILGFTRTAAEAVFPVSGIQPLSQPDLFELMALLEPNAVLMRRSLLETAINFRHPISYTVITQNNPVSGDLEVFVYQRTKKVGEQRLVGMNSIGIGGHAELEQVTFTPNNQIDVAHTMQATMYEELKEEVTFDGLGLIEFNSTPHRFTRGPEFIGVIMDNSDAVGEQHVGFLSLLKLASPAEVVCTEPELLTVGFVSLEKLLSPESEYKFENWSRLVLEKAYELLV